MQSIKIKKTTYKRLVDQIEDFGETVDNVINKALDAFEAQKKKEVRIKPETEFAGTQLQFKSTQIPRVYHSKPMSIIIDGVKTSVQNWIEIFEPIIEIAWDRGLANNKLRNKYAISIFDNPQYPEKYHFVSKMGIWVRRRSSEHIVESLRDIAKDLQLEIEIEIRWLQNLKAQFPGRKARIQIS